MMTEREAMEIVAMLVAAYPVPAWPTETIKLYAIELAQSRAEAEPARAAAREWYRVRPERPGISDLLGKTSKATHEARQRQAQLGRRAEVLTLPSPEERERKKARVQEIIKSLVGKIGA
jgi:hypothetical protein